jgi:hypothetical protein
MVSMAAVFVEGAIILQEALFGSTFMMQYFKHGTHSDFFTVSRDTSISIR